MFCLTQKPKKKQVGGTFWIAAGCDNGTFSVFDFKTLKTIKTLTSSPQSSAGADPKKKTSLPPTLDLIPPSSVQSICFLAKKEELVFADCYGKVELVKINAKKQASLFGSFLSSASSKKGAAVDPNAGLTYDLERIPLFTPSAAVLAQRRNVSVMLNKTAPFPQTHPLVGMSFLALTSLQNCMILDFTRTEKPVFLSTLKNEYYQKIQSAGNLSNQDSQKEDDTQDDSEISFSEPQNRFSFNNFQFLF